MVAILPSTGQFRHTSDIISDLHHLRWRYSQPPRWSRNSHSPHSPSPPLSAVVLQRVAPPTSLLFPLSLSSLTTTTPLSSCTAESCSPYYITLPAVAILARHHHPSQQLYCGELLFATLPAAAHHTHRHHPSQWLYFRDLLFATLPAAAHHAHLHHPSQWLYFRDLFFATLPAAAHHTRRRHP